MMDRYSIVVSFVAALGSCFYGGTAQYANCNGTVTDIGNGQCDAVLNVPSCGYDGGDCCPCTCVDGPTHSCSTSDFDCMYPDCGGSECHEDWAKDGFCDLVNNHPSCDYDGGDCCECSCIDGPDYGCGSIGFACLDPDCGNTTETAPENTTCEESWMNDGYCDSSNNYPSCDYDGGDCCECSCVDGHDYECGSNGFSCLDPACFDPALVAEFPDCDAGWLGLGDGFCDSELNTASCGWDGGDCCVCSCNGTACSISDFDCFDPNADEFFECQAPPPATLPCSVEVQLTWLVETPLQAQTLAAAVNCSGSFEVEWRGRVAIVDPIYIGGGTVLTITGDGASSVIDGNTLTRLFTVNNAVLHLSNLNISNGASIVGGAIAAANSSLTFNGTNFVGNQATRYGGGVYVIDGSDVSCVGGGTLADNTADVDGGAMFVTGDSVVSCGSSWVNNSAGNSGGAVVVHDGSSISWGDGATFAANSAGWGGAVRLSNGSHASWSGETAFNENKAAYYGGAFVVFDGSSAGWTGDTLLADNQAGLYGGAIAVVNSHVSCDSEGLTSTFSGNAAQSDGGAVYLYSESSIALSGSIVFDGNSAVEGGGGAIVISSNCSATWDGLMSFTGNSANLSGGALMAFDARHVGCSGETKFSGNSATVGWGGGVFLANSSMSWSGKMEMTNNTADLGGGAIFMTSSAVSWTGDTAVFADNQAGEGGAVAAADNSTLSWSEDISRDTDGPTSTFSGNTAQYNGGAVSLNSESSIALGGNSSFDGNSAVDGGGGAIAIGGNCTAIWGGLMSFTGNSANLTGGALMAWDARYVGCSGETEFVGNSATVDWGGGICLAYSTMSWSGKMEMKNNTAGWAGGAIFLGMSEVSWTGDTVFADNRAGAGGAVYVAVNSNLSWSGDGNTVFDDNQAGYGGAIAVQDSHVSCDTEEPTSTFSGNSAQYDGGAVHLEFESSIALSGNTVFHGNSAVRGGGGAITIESNCTAAWDGLMSFTGNSANLSGGALMALDALHVGCSGETKFSGNSATVGWGGGVLLANSSMSWSGKMEMTNNTADLGGGAIFMTSSAVSWTGDTAVFADNQAGEGGAVAAAHNSTLSWSEDISRDTDGPTSTFSGNTAQYNGGAVSLNSASSIALGGNTSFDGNSAVDGGGGAIAIGGNCTAIWGGLMSFTGNSANLTGGALLAIDALCVCSGETKFSGNSARIAGGGVVLLRSDMTWSGKMEMTNNTAGWTGGAIFVGTSEVSWTGDTEFLENKADAGGAVSAVDSVRLSWSDGTTTFTDNSATISGTFLEGGALYVGIDSEVSWSSETTFTGNEANSSGGAIFIYDGSLVGWTGHTKFSSNSAGADGGVVGSSVMDPEFNRESNLTINGHTIFTNNTCGANGGVLALLGGGLHVEFGAAGVVFSNNTAAVAGGAVFVSGADVGPVLSDVLFEANVAQVGGAVSTVGSGNLKEYAGLAPPNPTIFTRCRFVNNQAAATGGAVETAAGQDVFVDCLFKNNQAGTGGALRLAGTATLENCSFVENVSEDGGGAAVSNIGSISKMDNISYRGNVFSCALGMFLDFNASGDPNEAACDGCQTPCDDDGCFEEPPLVPICALAMEHTGSAGGTNNITLLRVDDGFWRATPYAIDVLPCYNANACLAGVTNSSGSCLDGYEGPYCSICSDGYTAGLSFKCSECSDSAGGIILASFLAVVALLVAVAVVSYVVSDKVGEGSRGTVERLGRYIPLQSAKIVVVSWQILTQFTAVANVTYPDVYQRFLDGLGVFNFDLSWVLSAGCIVVVDFHDRLLISTIGPIVALLFLCWTYAAATRINRGATETLQVIWNRHVSMVLLLTVFVYSSVSSTLFQTFACESLADGETYLRADYRITCDSSKHKALQVYAGVMVVVYTVGIPALYGVLLFRDRDVLKRSGADREETARVISTSELWKPYKPSVFYYEVIECGRRVLLAGVVVFIYPNTAPQIAITLLMAFAFVVVSEGLAPYASRWDTWLSRMGHAVVFVSMYVALLLKVDVSNERVESQRVFEVVLVAAHACMILVIVIETVVLTCALTVGERDGPALRFWKALFRSRQETIPSSDDVSEVELSPIG